MNIFFHLKKVDSHHSDDDRYETILITPCLNERTVFPEVMRDTCIKLIQHEQEQEQGQVQGQRSNTDTHKDSHKKKAKNEHWAKVQVIEKAVSVDKLMKWIENKQIIEIFATDSVNVTTKIQKISCKNRGHIYEQSIQQETPWLSQQLRNHILDMQHGVIEHPWSVVAVV
ncbi:hypothetical protein RFI_38662 [Reticulomyxa filosa]|uniref:Uncharacterized protein n=1 Tax=Reticulomyxa filosa TaxID=46433 RepID=X6LBU3_RETFI|nr:hypothetical protein RFI_38662 [Reticulomyxa filosa]|eukprot:ETN98825.1 hypothetical protein RFI_38662 [Reticulomyxa filosa]